MENLQLEKICQVLFDIDIKIYLQTVPGKWYESKYELNKEPIKLNTIYGIAVDGSSSIDFDFKTGKREDTILKTFITQTINKYEAKKLVFVDGKLKKQTKKEIIAKLKNSDRTSKYFFYTTLYGIGYFCMFMSEDTFNETNNKLSKYLKKKEIAFTNEFSEAHWVYRFVMNQDVKVHNILLNDFKM